MALILKTSSQKPQKVTVHIPQQVVLVETPTPPPIHKVLVEPDHASTVTDSLTMEYLTLHSVAEKYQMKSIMKRMEDLKKALQTYANEHLDNAKPAIFVCDKGEVEFSERGKVAVVKDPMALVSDLVTKFDEGVAFSVVDIAITPLRKILNEVELKAYLEDQPGSRTLRSVRPHKE